VSEQEKVAVDHFGDQIDVVEIERRPWLVISQLCDVIGVNPGAQERRLLMHSQVSGLDVAVITGPDNKEQLCLPAEEVSWWLRTLRPKEEHAKAAVAKLRQTLPYMTMREWKRSKAYFGDNNQTTRLLNKAAPLPRQTPKRKTRITKAMAQEMIELRESTELSYASIGVRFGLSAATVCQIVNGKYPVALVDES